jgi:hypothetical protein
MVPGKKFPSIVEKDNFGGIYLEPQMRYIIQMVIKASGSETNLHSKDQLFQSDKKNKAHSNR